MDLDAPIVAVTVHPRRARVTRRGRAALPAGVTEVVLGGLPDALVEDSVRVSGRADGAVRIVGVDVAHRDLADVPDGRVRAAEEAVTAAERALAGVEGADAGEAAREELLWRLARSSGARLAAALAEGTAGEQRVAEVGSAVAAQLTEVAATRRGHAERRTAARHALDAAVAERDRLSGPARHRRDAVVGVETDAAGEVELELTYVVDGAGWSSAYDARLDDAGALTLTWHGMVTQSTGEDWPACELTLSTARPASAAALPELTPWWVDVAPPPQPRPAPMMAAAAPAGPPVLRQRAMALEAAPVEDASGEPTGSWRLARPTAVAADGTPHRTTVTTVTEQARLDHLTAPVLGPEVHLRATVTNGSGHVLPAGPVATFLADVFVGTTSMPVTAAGEELELALGLDDGVVVERELASRTADKARFGSGRRATQHWTITVTNRRRATATVTVRDRLPVSRHADVSVVDVAVTPEPAERDELGHLEWVARIEPGQAWEASIRFGVAHPRDAALTGWR